MQDAKTFIVIVVVVKTFIITVVVAVWKLRVTEAAVCIVVVFVIRSSF